MTTQPPPPAPLSPPEFAQDLAQQIARVRRWRRVVVLATAGALALTLVLAWIVGESVLDFLIVLPWWLRALGLLACLGGAGWMVWRQGVLVARQTPNDDAVALMVERGLPEFRSRFIAAVQLARGASTPLVRALVAETTALARTKRLHAAIDKRALRRALAFAATAAGIGVALWFAGGGHSAALLRRAALSTEPAPRRTKLHMLSGGKAIGFGEDFKIEAGVSGAVPVAGRLHLKSATGRRQDLPLEADPARRTYFTRTLASATETFDYFVTLGDARSEVFHVKVQPRPVVVSAEAVQKFPAYTKRPPQSGTLSDLQLVIGSRLALRVKAGAPVRSGAIQFVAGEQVLTEAPLVPDANDATRLAGEIAIAAKNTSGLKLRLVDADGVESGATTVYRVVVAADQPPAVKIRQPDRRVELLTPGATMLLAFEAKDEFGLSKIRLHYAVDWTEGAPSQAVDLDGDGDFPRELARQFDWKITKLQPPVNEGQVIDYWLEALDTQQPPRAGTMEHYQARIVSEFEKRADLADRVSDTVKALDELRQGEEGLGAALGEALEKPAGEAIAPELLRTIETRQGHLAGGAQKLVGQLDATLAEYERNKITGADADAVKKMHDFLERLSTGGMPAVVDLLGKARATDDARTARKLVAEAGAAQKEILAQIVQSLAEHGRQQEGREFSSALGRLADRQAANLQKAIESGRRPVVKKPQGFGLANPVATVSKVTFDEQATEQAALAVELKSVAEKIARFAKEPGHAEMAQRFQQIAAEAQRVQPVAEAAAAMLKDGQLFKAGGEEKTVRDTLRRLAKQIAPPQSTAEAVHIAERELGRMIAEETAIATEAQQAGAQENLTVLENRQGALVTKSDLLAQDLVSLAPDAALTIRAAFEKMQDVRATLLDKAMADAAQHAQAALTNLEKARGQVAQLELRAAAPPRQPVAPNRPPPAPLFEALERPAGELAKIIEAEQKLELETAKILVQSLPNTGALLKGLDVRQADLRAQTGNVKTALAGEPAEAVEALETAGRDMGAAKAQIESGDGPGANATERKVLAHLYRAMRVLSLKLAQAGEQPGGNEAVQANAMAQTAAQVAQAQTALAESQRGFQKFEAARKAGEANAKIMQETAAILARAAQQAGGAAAGARVTGEAARRTLQEAAQDAADATAQATAGNAAAAQEKTGTAQGKLAQAAIAIALEQAGLAASDPPAGPGTGSPSKPPLDFTGLAPRDRATLEQAQSEKYPGEYGPLVEQYFRRLSDESARK